MLSSGPLPCQAECPIGHLVQLVLSDIIRCRARAGKFYRNYNSFRVIVVLTGHYKLSECQAASLKNETATCFLFVLTFHNLKTPLEPLPKVN